MLMYKANSTGGIYDLVAFDSMGAGSIVPFNCSNTVLNPSNLINGLTLSNASDTDSRQNWVRAGKLANQCLNVEKDLGKHIGTTAVAQDLMRVVDALREDGLLRYWGTPRCSMLRYNC